MAEIMFSLYSVCHSVCLSVFAQPRDINNSDTITSPLIAYCLRRHQQHRLIAAILSFIAMYVRKQRSVINYFN